MADCIGLLVLSLPDSYAMLMKPNKAETAVHGCHCPGDILLCACVRYCPDRGLELSVSLAFIVVFPKFLSENCPKREKKSPEIYKRPKFLQVMYRHPGMAYLVPRVSGAVR